MNSRRKGLRRALPLAGLLAIVQLGCQAQTQIDLERRVTTLEQQLAERDNQLAARQATIDNLHARMQTVRALTDEDLKRIFYPEQIVLASLTGGDDYDGQPGDDGITVYLRPIDRAGDALKVAGDIRVELYDLQNPTGQKLIGEYEFPVDQVSQLWYGKFATYHYTLRCPWQNGPPTHDEITIRVTFVDYLTQRSMSTQAVRKVQTTRK